MRTLGSGVGGGPPCEQCAIFFLRADRRAGSVRFVQSPQRDQVTLVILRMRVEVRLELEQRLCALPRHRVRRTEAHLNFLIFGPLRRGFVQHLERLVGIAQAQQRVAEQREDERGVTLRDERQLPCADRLLVPSAGGVARSQIERRGEELGVQAQRLAELCRGWLELALRIQRQTAHERRRHCTVLAPQRAERFIESSRSCVVDGRGRARLAARRKIHSLQEEADDLRREHRRTIEALNARGERHHHGPRSRSQRSAVDFRRRRHRLADADGTRDAAHLLAIGADDRTDDVVARRQQRRLE